MAKKVAYLSTNSPKIRVGFTIKNKDGKRKIISFLARR